MTNRDTDNRLWGLLGFFLPPAGIVLFLVWRFEKPKDACHALKGGIAGLVCWVVVRVAVGVIWWWVLWHGVPV
ncbi:MAG TPA: hypothetical protein P5154_02300 [Candidatus Izemoplasmatales bacterium]|nr:hypothetical protein [Bacillota bacterium]HRY77576.1 hypothetical protein [Candidatus Izemoplasmatales bacterium]